MNGTNTKESIPPPAIPPQNGPIMTATEINTGKRGNGTKAKAPESAPTLVLLSLLSRCR